MEGKEETAVTAEKAEETRRTGAELMDAYQALKKNTGKILIPQNS
jgi:hypothetical protein